jgi:hypothetical protein
VAGGERDRTSCIPSEINAFQRPMLDAGLRSLTQSPDKFRTKLFVLQRARRCIGLSWSAARSGIASLLGQFKGTRLDLRKKARQCEALATFRRKNDARVRGRFAGHTRHFLHERTGLAMGVRQDHGVCDRAASMSRSVSVSQPRKSFLSLR